MPSEELVKYSLHNLEHRLGRSSLTILSIFVGITTIFVFISFGLGLYNFVDAYSTGSSVDKFTVMQKGAGVPGLDESFAITEKDLDAVKKTAGVFDATGMYAKAAEVKQDKTKKYVFLIGYEPDKPILFDVSGIKIKEGRALRPGDKGKVVVGYNYAVKNKIFPKAYSVNQKIEIQGRDYRIIGIYEPIGNPQDDSQIYLTNDDFRELYGSNLKGYMMLMGRLDKSIINTAIKRIESSLRDSRDIKVGKEDFFVQSFQDLIATYSKVLQGIAAFVILIAMLSVLVSAINTANTMITSVMERTREIGVMKAVGARNSEVFRIFLFESALLGFVAGIFGVLAGYGISALAGNFLASIGWSIFKPYFSFWLFFNLVLFATLTGAISGAIPAYQASRVSPVKALRYE